MKFCTHDWRKVKRLYEYIDYSGFGVGVFECICNKCGKTKNKKFLK